MKKIIERIMYILGAAFLLLATIILIVKFKDIIGDVPVHYNVAGEADSYGSKYSIIFLLVLAWVMFIVIAALKRFPNLWNVPSGWAFEPLRMMVAVLDAVLAAGFSYIVIATTLGMGLGAWFVFVFLGFTFGTIIVGMFFSYRNRD